MEARAYVPGQNINLDKLLQTYDNANNSPLAERTPEKERSTQDPLGFQEKPEGNEIDRAKLAVDKLIKLAALLLGEYGVFDPAARMYAYELFSLNVINSVDCPLSPAEVDRVRREAFDYYDKATKSPG